MEKEDASGPLSGLTVLELGNFIAAPFAGRILADFGADVIKVEKPGTGDELRNWRLYQGRTSLLFRTLNRNKRSITLNLSTQEGREICLDLVRRSDIVLENFRPGALERWGMGPEELCKVNPDLVLVRISGYGQSGPYRDRPGFGGVAEAIGGIRDLTGFPDRPPTRTGISLADSVAGLYTVIGALMGLRKRNERRGGDIVDVALYEGIFSLMESLLPDYDAFGVTPERSGSSLSGIAPSNTYACADGKYVVISGNGDAVYRRLMAVVGRPDLAEDPSLADNAGRVARAAELDDVIGAWAAGLPCAAALRALEQASVPCGPIYTVQDMARDPHFIERGMLERHSVDLDDETTEEVAFPGVVPVFQDTPGGTRWLGPDLGEHTDTVLDELGLDTAQREEYRARGVL